MQIIVKIFVVFMRYLQILLLLSMSNKKIGLSHDHPNKTLYKNNYHYILKWKVVNIFNVFLYYIFLGVRRV